VLTKVLKPPLRADMLALASYLKQVPPSTYDGGANDHGQPDLSKIASSYATSLAMSSLKGAPGSGRRLQAAPPQGGGDAKYKNCSSKSELTLYFAFPKSTDDSQWNQVQFFLLQHLLETSLGEWVGGVVPSML